MRTLVLVAVAIIGEPLVAAPVPVFHSRQVVPGTYSMYWNGTTYQVRFGKDGSYLCRGVTACWFGCWLWDARKRVLYVSERMKGTYERNPTSNYVWSVRLDENLHGSQNNAVPRTIRLTRILNAPLKGKVQ